MLERLRTARRAIAALVAAIAGLLGLGLLLLLGFNVLARMIDVNIIWVSETARLLFVWGVALGAIAVSLSDLHFRVDLRLAGRDDPLAPGWWDAVLQVMAIAALGFVLIHAAPTIAKAGMQMFASLPLDYGVMRLAIVVGLAGMLGAHVWRLVEILVSLWRPSSFPRG
ncbi:MAG: TRAP transporter small permease subunit [Azospirillaceae bacterium]